MRPIRRSHADDYDLKVPARIAGHVLVPSIRAVAQAAAQGADMARVTLARLRNGAVITLEGRVPGRFDLVWRFGAAEPRPVASLDLPGLMAFDDDALVALVRRVARWRVTARRRPFARRRPVPRRIRSHPALGRVRTAGVPATRGRDGHVTGFPMPPMAAMRGVDADSLGGRLVAGFDGEAVAPAGTTGLCSFCADEATPSFARTNPLLVRAHLIRTPDVGDIGRAVQEAYDGEGLDWTDVMRPGRWYMMPDLLVFDERLDPTCRDGLRDVRVMPALRPAQGAVSRQAWASMGALLFNNAYASCQLCLGDNDLDDVSSTPADGMFVSSTPLDGDRSNGVRLTTRTVSVFAARRLVDAMALTPSNGDLDFTSGRGLITRMGELVGRLPWDDDDRSWCAPRDVYCQSGSEADLFLGRVLDALGLVSMTRWTDRPGRPNSRYDCPACRFYLAQDLFLDEHAPDLDRTHPSAELSGMLARFWDCLLNGIVFTTGEPVEGHETGHAFGVIDHAVNAIVGACNPQREDDDDGDDDMDPSDDEDGENDDDMDPSDDEPGDDVAGAVHAAIGDLDIADFDLSAPDADGCTERPNPFADVRRDRRHDDADRRKRH